MMRVFNTQPPLNNTLQEDFARLEEEADGVYGLYFCFHHYGMYDLIRNKIQGIVVKAGLSVMMVDLES